MSANLSDTIAAIATAPGEAGLCVVRISGPEALSVADSVFRGNSRPSRCETQTVHYGSIVDSQDGEVDEVLLTVFRSPHTYTCEDVVEISGHGGYRPGARILSVLLRNGARLAHPGEFTRRAFMNGRLDLLQAEAVCELIKSRTDSANRAGVRQLHGGFSEMVHGLRDETLQLLSLVEVGLDFTEEDIDEISYERFEHLSHTLWARLDDTIQRAGSWRKLSEGARIVLIGRPNVGKSSLLNRFVGEDRAIVDPAAGTTRDTIEVSFDCHGIPVTVVDTAGIRSGGRDVEIKGIERTLRETVSADMFIWLVDGSEALQAEDRSVFSHIDAQRSVGVVNKSDVDEVLSGSDLDEFGLHQWLRVSALTGTGCDELMDLIYQQLVGRNDLSESQGIVNTRQMDCLTRAKDGVERANNVLRSGGYQDLVALELKSVLSDLDELLGIATGDDVLDAIFSSFCIGK